MACRTEILTANGLTHGFNVAMHFCKIATGSPLFESGIVVQSPYGTKSVLLEAHAQGDFHKLPDVLS